MSLPSRFFFITLTALLLTIPAQAQTAQSSDVGGVVPQSDVSGSLTQSDLVFFQSDENRIRLNDIAARLSEALQTGRLGRSVTRGQIATHVTPELRALFLGDGPVALGQSSFSNGLQSRGLAARETHRLTKSLTGLLENGTAQPAHVLKALGAFNAAVDAAPASFLTQPPADFLVARAILMTLSEGSPDA